MKQKQTNAGDTVSHTRRSIEFTIVVIAVAVLAVIAIPTITSISKWYAYSTAYSRCHELVSVYEIAHNDALQNGITAPTDIRFTQALLRSAEIPDQNSDYYTMISQQIRTYLPRLEIEKFSFTLTKIDQNLTVYYWPTTEQSDDPTYVYIVENRQSSLISYSEYIA